MHDFLPPGFVAGDDKLSNATGCDELFYRMVGLNTSPSFYRLVEYVSYPTYALAANRVDSLSKFILITLRESQG